MRVVVADYVTRLGTQTYFLMGHPTYLGNNPCEIDYEDNSYDVNL